MKLTSEQIMAAVEDDECIGFCVACGNEQGGCEACGELKVYGAEELLLMGYCDQVPDRAGRGSLSEGVPRPARVRSCDASRWGWRARR